MKEAISYKSYKSTSKKCVRLATFIIHFPDTVANTKQMERYRAGGRKKIYIYGVRATIPRPIKTK